MAELSPNWGVNYGRCVRNYMLGTGHRWAACLAASRIVGAYQAGASLSLAKDLAVSVSQVENLARAGLVYRWLRKLGPEVQGLRVRLTPSHFVAVGDACVQWDVPLPDLLEALRVAASEGASVASLRSYLQGEYGGGVDAWRGHYGRAVSSLRKLAGDYGVPPAVQLIAERAVKDLEGLGW